MPRFLEKPRKHRRRVLQKIARGRPRFIVERCTYDPCYLVIDRVVMRVVAVAKMQSGAYAYGVCDTLEHALRTEGPAAAAALIVALDRNEPIPLRPLLTVDAAADAPG